MSIKIALAGNPNSGKTTLFNALTGLNQYVGNWPGVTVEKKEGKLKGHKDITITDLPGIYSLSPYTLEEVISRNYLLDERPDAILNIVDGTNLERNLYLTTQLTELGIPVVLAVNMIDVMRRNGDAVNATALSEKLGCKVIEISALKGDGVDKAVKLAVEAARGGDKTAPQHTFGADVEHCLAHIEEHALSSAPEEKSRYYSIKLFERDKLIYEKLNISDSVQAEIDAHIRECEVTFADDSESIITAERYGYIDSIIKSCLKLARKKGALTISDKIDRVVTNRWLALPIFLAVMFAVYYISVTTIGTIVTDWTNDVLFGDIIPPAIETVLDSLNTADWLHSLVIDGIVAGVGAVIGFVPQMLILFIFLAFLEGCGYMARIAFILDRVFRRFGLSGKSFIPILIGTGCGVPGVMASRTIENERDRRMTVITTTFIPCGAKLPIIGLIAGAMFGNAGWVATSSYFIGMAAIICSGIILKKTKQFSGGIAPFIMELPAYHWPTFGFIFRTMWERGWSFIKRAGTIILAATVFVWFTSSFGWGEEGFGMVDMNDSMLASAGRAVAWIFAPVGWGNWRAAVAAVTGLIAKENVVGTFGVLYGVAEVGEEGEEIWRHLAADYTALSAYSFLVFNLLCAPCFAALGAIRREMNSGKWFWTAVGYQCGFAYIVSLCVYRLGLLFTGGGFSAATVVALAFAVVFVWMLLRREPKHAADRLKGGITA
jgi:ferrous iron transport protein B